MKKNIQFTLLLASLLFSSSTLYANNDDKQCKEVSFQKVATQYAGHYYLNGVMEVGSELLLEPSGKFKWYLAVGGLDQYAEGVWWKNQDCIGLKPNKKYTKHLTIFPKYLDSSREVLDVVWKEGRQGTYLKATTDD